MFWWVGILLGDDLWGLEYEAFCFSFIVSWICFLFCFFDGVISVNN